MEIRRSDGRARNGAQVFYIRPSQDCANKSYRLKAFTLSEYNEKLAKIEKKIKPEKLFLIDGYRIVASTSQQALKEYWRTCEKSKIGKIFEVINLDFYKSA